MDREYDEYDERKKRKHTHNIICAGHHYAQISKNNIMRHEPSYK